MNGRGLQIALAISLIFNVFVVGAFVGAAVDAGACEHFLHHIDMVKILPGEIHGNRHQR